LHLSLLKRLLHKNYTVKAISQGVSFKQGKQYQDIQADETPNEVLSSLKPHIV
jgi:hypothetical protein